MMHKTELLMMIPLIIGMMLYTAIPAGASSVTTFAYPSKNVAEIFVNDTVYAVFHYPADSFFSRVLNGTSYSYSASVSNVPQNSEFFQNLQEALAHSENENQDNGDPANQSIQLLNVSVIISKKFFANQTTAVYVKSSEIIMWVSGLFAKNGTRIVGNFAWKSFKVDKHLYLMENGNMEDLNFFGDDLMERLGMEGIMELPEVSTLNFSQFNQPLSEWNRVYNPSTNMTLFTKSVSTQTIYSENLTINGKSYSLNVVSDPTYTIGIQGYATAVGNEVYVSPAPSQFTAYGTVYVVTVFIVVIVAAGVFIARRKK
jgi:hypothetical protein